MNSAAKKSIRALAALLPVVVTVQGETLYQQHGITLEGMVKMVTLAAGVCRVLASHHPSDVYEQMEPGEQKSDTVFVLAFHDQVPKFESRPVDFRFAAGSAAGTSRKGWRWTARLTASGSCVIQTEAQKP